MHMHNTYTALKCQEAQKQLIRCYDVIHRYSSPDIQQGPHGKKGMWVLVPHLDIELLRFNVQGHQLR